jgi:hypothetical protein
MSRTSGVHRMAAGVVPVALAVGLALAGCGGVGAGGGSGRPGSGSSGQGGFALTVGDSGGFVSPQELLRRVPAFALFPDGTAVTPGPQIMVYPGSALPNLVVRRIAPAGTQAILRAADDAGLLGPSHGITLHSIADATTTTFTLTREGVTHRISVYALDAAANDPELPQADRAEARRLVAFRDALGDLGRWLPRGSVGPESPYQPTVLLVFVTASRGLKDLPAAPPELAQEAARWPLATPLATFGRPFAQMTGVRCGAVTGQDLRTLLPVVRGATELTPWLSDGRYFSLLVRPLLPGERGCAALAGEA